MFALFFLRLLNLEVITITMPFNFKVHGTLNTAKEKGREVYGGERVAVFMKLVTPQDRGGPVASEGVKTDQNFRER